MATARISQEVPSIGDIDVEDVRAFTRLFHHFLLNKRPYSAFQQVSNSGENLLKLCGMRCRLHPRSSQILELLGGTLGCR